MRMEHTEHTEQAPLQMQINRYIYTNTQTRKQVNTAGRSITGLREHTEPAPPGMQKYKYKCKYTNMNTKIQIGCFFTQEKLPKVFAYPNSWNKRLENHSCGGSVLLFSSLKCSQNWVLGQKLVTSPRQTYSVYDQAILESSVQTENRDSYQHGGLLVGNADNSTEYT